MWRASSSGGWRSGGCTIPGCGPPWHQCYGRSLRGVFRVACLKGLALADGLYEDPGLRPSTDLDLLIADADFTAAIEVLSALGWQAEGGRPDRFHRGDRHDVELMRRKAPMVELHFRAMRRFVIGTPTPPFFLTGFQTLLCDSGPAAATFLTQGLVRMARLRAEKYLPWIGPKGTP